MSKLQEAVPETAAIGADTAAGGGNGRGRGTGRAAPATATAAKPPQSPVASTSSARGGEDGARDDGEVSSPDFSTPIAAQESAERKESQSPDYLHGVRKSPRSKEVRRVSVCGVSCSMCSCVCVSLCVFHRQFLHATT